MAPSAERLRELLKYDPETGQIAWRKGRKGRAAGTPAGGKTWHGYRRIGVDGCRLLEHVLIWIYMTGAPPIGDIDHVNGARDDNRWANLRQATRSENNQNQRKARTDNAAGLLGVSPNRSRWSASISVDRRKRHLGTFDTPELAHAAYLEAKRALHPAGTI